MVRRFVEECGITFEAAATAKLLILTMLMRTTPSDDLLINSHFVAQAYDFSDWACLTLCTRPRKARPGGARCRGR
eukprot:6213429-Pleurochrysis_carterae.AAC.5